MTSTEAIRTLLDWLQDFDLTSLYAVLKEDYEFTDADWQEVISTLQQEASYERWIHNLGRLQL